MLEGIASAAKISQNLLTFKKKESVSACDSNLATYMHQECGKQTLELQ